MNRIDPGLAAALESDVDPRATLRLVAITAELSEDADQSLRGAVDSARAAGLSWKQIGDTLGISRQAAQQRFRRDITAPDSEVWHMYPVTSFDEMAKLNEAGRYGWHSVGFGTLFHDLVRTDEQWEHRRIGLFSLGRVSEEDGWQRIGNMWFPWAYYARPTGVEALPGDPADRQNE